MTCGEIKEVLRRAYEVQTTTGDDIFHELHVRRARLFIVAMNITIFARIPTAFVCETEKTQRLSSEKPHGHESFQPEAVAVIFIVRYRRVINIFANEGTGT